MHGEKASAGRCGAHRPIELTKPGARRHPIPGWTLLMRRAAAPFLLLLLLLAAACSRGGGDASARAEAKGAALYFCPMHPEVTSDRKGSCPICGMDLVPREASSPGAPTGPAPVPGKAAVTLDPAQVARLNLRFDEVRVRALARELRASATVVPAENRLHRVTAKVGGYVEALYAGVTGEAVRRGQPLLTLYSPELYATQQEYLSALATSEKLGASPRPEVARGGRELARAARARLLLWDFTEAQVRDLEETRQPQRTVTLYAPASGAISERMVLAGQRIEPGEPLLVLADLSTVWAEVDIPESDLSLIQVGTMASLTLPSSPGQAFRAKVAFLNPFLDPASRTLRARLEIPNPGLALRPGMYAEARFDLPLGEVLSLPASAVLRDGLRTFAFLAGEGGRLTPVAIQVGVQGGEFAQLLGGLKAGDRVASSANFLLDSESSLKAALDAALARPPAQQTP